MGGTNAVVKGGKGTKNAPPPSMGTKSNKNGKGSGSSSLGHNMVQKVHNNDVNTTLEAAQQNFPNNTKMLHRNQTVDNPFLISRILVKRRYLQESFCFPCRYLLGILIMHIEKSRITRDSFLVGINHCSSEFPPWYV